MRRRSSPQKRVWEEKTQDMEKPCMFWGSAESFIVTGEAGEEEAFSTVLENLGFASWFTGEPLKIFK